MAKQYEWKYFGPEPVVGEIIPRFIKQDERRLYKVISYVKDPDAYFHYEYILTVEEYV
jgi:hypothetical protein